jgi:RHS repeat-associated protein
LLTDHSGNVVKCYDYYPFGAEIAAGVDGRPSCYSSGSYPASPDLASEKFTGKERDTETGLDFFGARYFSGPQGRFSSPDPYNAMLVEQNMKNAGLPDGAAVSFFNGYLENPQNWNKYAYVRNNPLELVDPTGAAPIEGHHLITGRQILTSPLAQDFTNAIKTGPLSGNGFPNQPGFNGMHRAYNAAVEDLLQQAEQVSGDRNSWSLSQWQTIAKQILNSDEPAIKEFLEELEKNNPGAKAAVSGAITAYRVSVSLAARIFATDLMMFLRMPLVIVDPAIINPQLKEKISPSHRDCLIDRDSGNCVI